MKQIAKALSIDTKFTYQQKKEKIVERIEALLEVEQQFKDKD